MASMKSTPINQLPGLTSPPSQIDGPNMVGNPAVRESTQTSPQSALVRSEDMVNEILNEIDAVNVENNRNVENTSALERQIDPNVNAQLGTPSREQVEQMTQEQVVSPLPSHTVPEVDQTPTPSSVSQDTLSMFQGLGLPIQNEGLLSQVVNWFKNPLIVVVLAFAFNLPIFNRLLIKIPQTVSSSGQITIIGSAVKALLVGFTFLLITRLV